MFLVFLYIELTINIANPQATKNPSTNIKQNAGTLNNRGRKGTENRIKNISSRIGQIRETKLAKTGTNGRLKKNEQIKKEFTVSESTFSGQYFFLKNNNEAKKPPSPTAKIIELRTG